MGLFSGGGDVRGQITGGQRSADGSQWQFIDQGGNVLTSMPLNDFYSTYGRDGSGFGYGKMPSQVNGVQSYYSADAIARRQAEYQRQNAPQSLPGFGLAGGAAPSAPTNGIADPRGNNFLGGQASRPPSPQLAPMNPGMARAAVMPPPAGGYPQAPAWGAPQSQPGFAPKFNSQPTFGQSPLSGLFGGGGSGGGFDQQQLIQLLLRLFGGR
jgi:hypothetical protein